MSRWAIIPARGGSKRIPRKNIRLFAGRPMIHWAIDAAIQSGLFDQIVVSTDDEEVAHCAREAGASVPFMRPAELADDFTPTRDVINHAILQCQKLTAPASQVCCIYATSPLLQVNDLKNGLACLEEGRYSFVFSATHFPYPIQRALRLLPSGGVAMFEPAHAKTRSQDLEPAFHDAGMFYWGKTQAFIDREPMFSERAFPLIIPPFRVCDLDTAEDWERAEWLKRAIELKNASNAS